MTPLVESAPGSKPEWPYLNGKPVLPPDADIHQTIADVSFLPILLKKSFLK